MTEGTAKAGPSLPRRFYCDRVRTRTGMSALQSPLHAHDLAQRVHYVHQIACASITASMDLYAMGVSSMTFASLRHSTPAVALAWSSSVKRRFASVRDMARPAP